MPDCLMSCQDVTKHVAKFQKSHIHTGTIFDCFFSLHVCFQVYIYTSKQICKETVKNGSSGFKLDLSTILMVSSDENTVISS